MAKVLVASQVVLLQAYVAEWPPKPVTHPVVLKLRLRKILGPSHLREPVPAISITYGLVVTIPCNIKWKLRRCCWFRVGGLTCTRKIPIVLWAMFCLLIQFHVSLVEGTSPQITGYPGPHCRPEGSVIILQRLEVVGGPDRAAKEETVSGSIPTLNPKYLQLSSNYPL